MIVSLSFCLFDFQNFVDVQDGLVCDADIQLLVGRPGDLSCRENACFSLSSFFLNEDPSFEVSVDDLLEATRYLGIKSLPVCQQLCPGNCISRLQIGSRLRGFNLVHPYHCFNRTTCTPGYLHADT